MYSSFATGSLKAATTLCGYRAVSKFITLRVMNSSIGWYMIYMIAAFLVIMLIAVLVY